MFSVFCFVPLALGLIACGDSVTTEQVSNNYTSGMKTVDFVSDLPACSADNAGDSYLVKEDGEAYLCSGQKWKVLGGSSGADTVYVSNSDTVYAMGVDFSCTTESLSDSSGVNILCNGEVIGTVLNGKDGAAGAKGDSGAAGAGCNVVSSTDTSTVIKCGDKTFTMKSGTGETSTVVPDENVVYDPCAEGGDEDAECSIDDIQVSGRSEKGPFLRGALVSAYELLNGRTLKQTGKIFNGEIDADDGLFNIKSVKLSSQYAIIRVSGVYRNEVTGNNSDNAIELRALTNLKGRKTANVNLMTHLEYNRVIYLVTQKGVSVSKAKHQAEREILAAFNIDTTKVKLTEKAEDLTIFGESEGNAALLAISILLQGDRSTADLKALLSSISDDLAEDGLWKNPETRAEIADWAYKTSLGISGTGTYPLSTLRSNVEKWGLQGTGGVPAFEKFISGFWHNEYGLKECDADAQDSKASLTSANSKDNKGLTLICDKKRSQNSGYYNDYEWREVVGIEKDHDHACNADRNKVEKYEKDGYWYECDASSNTWKLTTEIKMLNQENPGKTIGEYIDGSGKTKNSTADSVYKWNGNVWTYVDNNVEWYTHRFKDSIKTEGMYRPAKVKNTTLGVVYDEDGKWRDATANETSLKESCMAKERNKLNSVYSANTNVCDTTNGGSSKFDWRPATRLEKLANSSCTMDATKKNAMGKASKTDLKCIDGRWVATATYDEEAQILKYGEKDYKTVVIGDQTWMAENLDYDDSTVYTGMENRSWCYNNEADSCTKYGRLYNWAAAMDSAAVFSDAGKGCGFIRGCSPSGTIRGICPEGWHLPDTTEWKTMFATVGGISTAGTKLKSTSGWNDKSDGTSGNGEDSFGFSVPPAGSYSQGSFYSVGGNAYFWSSTENNPYTVNSMKFFNDFERAYVGGDYKIYGYSVRCLRD